VEDVAGKLNKKAEKKKEREMKKAKFFCVTLLGGVREDP